MDRHLAGIVSVRSRRQACQELDRRNTAGNHRRGGPRCARHKNNKVMILLGPLEITVMEILWQRGESNVRDVAEKLDRPLAYTTVMTTLDRLFKKGLLD